MMTRAERRRVIEAVEFFAHPERWPYVGEDTCGGPSFSARRSTASSSARLSAPTREASPRWPSEGGNRTDADERRFRHLVADRAGQTAARPRKRCEDGCPCARH